jgi:hypothetical protein
VTQTWSRATVDGTATNSLKWAAYNGASGPVSASTTSLDLTTNVAGLETVVTRYANAPPGGAVELWTFSRFSLWCRLDYLVLR